MEPVTHLATGPSTLIVLVAVEMHPLEFETVTVYVVGVVGATEIAAVDTAVFQTYVLPPDAVRRALAP